MRKFTFVLAAACLAAIGCDSKPATQVPPMPNAGAHTAPPMTGAPAAKTEEKKDDKAADEKKDIPAAAGTAPAGDTKTDADAKPAEGEKKE